MARLRLAIGGISHETNTYAVACSGITPLKQFRIERGAEIVENHRGVRSYIGGMLDAASEIDAEVVPTLFAIAEPSGTISADAYEAMKAELLRSLEEVLPVDAVGLELHGAGVVEGIEDLESDLAGAVRDLVGAERRIVAPLDLHGNITDRMGELIDLMLGVHYYPHTDMYERGHEVVSLLPALVAGELRPVTHVEHLPMLLPTSTTDLYPAQAVNEMCWKLEADPAVVDCTFFHGFPFTDTATVGVHVVVTTNGQPVLAKETAKTVASWIWEHREDFRPEADTPELALRRAFATAAEATGPVVVNDTADNCGGGAPGDATHVLRALLEAAPDRPGAACFGFIYDPAVAQAAHEAGPGAIIDVKLGGKHDDVHGEPLALSAYVKSVTDGRFVLQSEMGRGMRMDHGPMARLQVGGVDILVGSGRSQVFDPEVFLLHGIDVTRYDVVVVKSSNHFRAGFGALASQIITADSPGLTTQRVEVFDHHNHVGPLWPRDPAADYTP